MILCNTIDDSNELFNLLIVKGDLHTLSAKYVRRTNKYRITETIGNFLGFLCGKYRSTGECLGIAKSFNEALYKAFLGAGVQLPKHKQMIMTVKDADKPEAVGVAKRFEALGYKIYATRSTAKYLQEHGVNALRVNKITQESPNVMDLILGHKIDLVIDTPTQGNGDKTRDGFLIRRNAIETGVYCITAMDTANALARSLETANGQLTPVDIATVKNV